MLYEVITNPRPVLAKLARSGRAVLDAARRSAKKLGVEADTVLREPLTKRVADEVLSEAKKWRADLIRNNFV